MLVRFFSGRGLWAKYRYPALLALALWFLISDLAAASRVIAAAPAATGLVSEETLELLDLHDTQRRRRKKKKSSRSTRKSGKKKSRKGKRSRYAAPAPEQDEEDAMGEGAEPAEVELKGKVAMQLDYDAEDGMFPDSVAKIICIPQFDRRPKYDSVQVRFTLRADSLKSKVYWDTLLNVEVGDEARFTVVPREPGFFWGQAEVYHEGKLLAYQLKKFGFQAQWFFPAFAPPKDIKQFWAQALQEVEDLPKDYKLKAGPRHRWPSMQVYDVTLAGPGGVTLHGWLTVPKNAGTYPAILELPPYGNSMKPDLQTRDMIVFRLDVRGHGRSRKEVNPGFPGFLTTGIEDKQTYIYRGVVQDCMAALAFLQQHEKVNRSRIGVMGVSQGGGLASMVACLDSTVKAMAVSVPFMCNWNRIFETSYWPKRDFVKWVEQEPYTRSMTQVVNNLSYFDPCHLTQSCKAAVFMAVGLQDMTCPPDGAYAWYNTMTQQKQALVYKNGQHILPGVRGKMMQFLRLQLKW